MNQNPMDIEVAKEIFGHVVIMENGKYFVVTTDGRRKSIPPYSTDIEYAYKVLKKFMKEGYMIFISEEEGWKFVVEKDDEKHTYKCDAPLPTSICAVLLEHLRRMKEEKATISKEAEIISLDFGKGKDDSE